MHRSEDVAMMTEQLVITIRGMIAALPSRIAVDVAGAESPAEASVIIRRETNAILGELAKFKYDPSAYEKLVTERQKWTAQDEDV
jgi:hypothetical protein